MVGCNEYLILIMDDDPGILKAYSEELTTRYPKKYEVITAINPVEALHSIKDSPRDVDVALIDMWVGDNKEAGLELIEEIRKEVQPPECIVLTAHEDIPNAAKCMQTGAFYYISKSGPDSNHEKMNQLLEKAAEFRRTKKREFKISLIEMQNNLIKQGYIYYQNPFSIGQFERIKEYCAKLGYKLGITEKEMDFLDIALILHSIIRQKIGFLKKPGILTKIELDEVNTLSEYGRELMKENYPAEVKEAIMHYYANWDGSGIPFGLREDNISILSRILRVACEFDRGLNPHHQRFLRNPLEAINEIKEISGTKLDPDVVSELINLYDNDELMDEATRQWREKFKEVVKLIDVGCFNEADDTCQSMVKNYTLVYNQLKASFSLVLGDMFAQYDQGITYAIKYYNDAINLYPAFAEAFYKRGRCYLKQDMLPEAERDFLVCTAIIPTYIEAHLERAETLNRAKLTDEANSIVDKISNWQKNNGKLVDGR